MVWLPCLKLKNSSTNITRESLLHVDGSKLSTHIDVAYESLRPSTRSEALGSLYNHRPSAFWAFRRTGMSLVIFYVAADGIHTSCLISHAYLLCSYLFALEARTWFSLKLPAVK